MKNNEDIKNSKWVCRYCGYQLANFDIVDESLIKIYINGEVEAFISFDEVSTKCPNCRAICDLESPLLDTALHSYKGIIDDIDVKKTDIRVMAGALPEFEEEETIPRFTGSIRQKFLKTLSENQRKVYGIVFDISKNHRQDDPGWLESVFSSIKNKLGWTEEEAKRQTYTITSLSNKFKHIEKINPKIDIDKIKELYKDAEAYKNFIEEYFKQIKNNFAKDRSRDEANKRYLGMLDINRQEALYPLQIDKFFS
jgi:hypothetical protein